MKTAQGAISTATRSRARTTTFSALWYVYEWKDTDVTAGPSAGDTLTELGSGR